MELPEAINNFLNAKETFEKRDQIMRPLSTSLDVNIKFTKTINRLYDKEIGLQELIPELVKATGLPEDMIKKVVLELAGFEFLPISSHLGNVDEYIKSLGGDPAKYPATRITIRSLTPEEVVSEVLHENTLPVPAHLDMRLRETLESLVRGVRTKDDTVHRLTRAEKIGGVALTDEEAEKITNILAAKAASIKIDFSAPQSKSAAEAKPQAAAETDPSHRDGGGNAAPMPSVPVAPQMMQAMAPMATKPFEPRREINISESNVDFERQLASAAVRVAGGAGVPVPKELNERFMAIVAARLKEARKAGETLDTFKRPVNAGGMGFSDAVAETTSDLLEKELTKIKSDVAVLMKKEKEDFAKRQSQETVAREVGRRNTDAADLDRLYGKLSGNMPPRPVPPPRPAPAAPLAAAVPPASPSLTQKTVVSIPVIPVNRPASPAPAARPAPMPLPPVAPAPKMQDIRKAPMRLTGPAEELRNMNITDFRRLSSDPMEACRKLNDKLLLLEEQSYAERVEGVKAWQESPLNKLYQSILNESFGGGGGVSAVIRGREASSKESLTEAEVRAIMDFNRRLKS